MTNKSRPAVVVTGASTGIGKTIALALDANGFRVFAGVRKEADALVLSREARHGLTPVLLDVTDEAAIGRAVETIAAQTEGQLHGLVNNAGVAPKVRADILEATEESYDWVVGINLKGPYFLTQAVANWMIAQQEEAPDFEGCIVNISSISATVASPSRGEYCISKAGVSMATKLWAARLGEFGIPVYEIRPGVIKTSMTAPVTDKYDELIAEGLAIQPRWGLPEDIGRAVAMMVRGDLPYSTGQVIMVDGGMTVQRL